MGQGGGQITLGANTRVLAEVSVMVALAVVLNALRLYTLPQGGSITIGEMVPILFLALRRGVRVGIFAGAIFGIIDIYFEPYAFSPIQFLLDYPIAFGALGLAGFLKQRGTFLSAVGAAFGVGCRFLSHFVSGIVFFAINAAPGENPVLYSAVYNATYLIPGLVISELIIIVLVRNGALRFRI